MHFPRGKATKGEFLFLEWVQSWLVILNMYYKLENNEGGLFVPRSRMVLTIVAVMILNMHYKF